MAREDAALTPVDPLRTVFLYRKEKPMAIQTNYTQARAHFAELLERVTKDQMPIIIKRRGREGVVMIPESEYDSIMESYHLLRSPKNALRLYEALNRALEGKGKKMTVDELRREVGLDPQKT
jgi:antitoxin YefM